MSRLRLEYLGGGHGELLEADLNRPARGANTRNTWSSASALVITSKLIAYMCTWL